MNIFENLTIGSGIPDLWGDTPPLRPSTNIVKVKELLDRCPITARTPLVEASGVAALASVAKLYLKDERTRMGLGSFKALGAPYVIASTAAQNGGGPTALEGYTYVAASAGNHGLALAAAARVFGAQACVYLAASVPESFADRLREKGAQVNWHGNTYEESMDGAMAAAKTHGWILLSDSSWDGYLDLPHQLMEGYLQMPAEITEDIPTVPTHIFLQAGVGGMACAVAAYARDKWGSLPKIIVVEPEAAPALQQSVRERKIVTTSGPVSAMGRLDCKQPSLIALSALAEDANYFMTITEEEASSGIVHLAAHGFETTPSGGAAVAALLAAKDHHAELGLSENSVVLAIISECCS